MTDSRSTAGITAVISTCNRCDELQHTLQIMENAHQGLNIIVVDNASTDPTADMIRATFPQVKLIPQTENLPLNGYNIGFRHVRTPYVWVMDDDATPVEGTLGSMLEFLESRPACDAAAGNILNRAGESEWGPLPLPDVSMDWYNLIGCGFMVRHDALMQCNGYCESFGLYYNDLDLALRILARGGKIAFRHAWIVEHRAVPSSIRNRRKNLLMLRNFCFTVRNHYRGRRRWDLLIPHTVKFLRPAIRDAGLRKTLKTLYSGLTAPPGRDTLLLPGVDTASALFLRKYSFSGTLSRWMTGK